MTEFRESSPRVYVCHMTIRALLFSLEFSGIQGSLKPENAEGAREKGRMTHRIVGGEAWRNRTRCGAWAERRAGRGPCNYSAQKGKQA